MQLLALEDQKKADIEVISRTYELKKKEILEVLHKQELFLNSAKK